MQDTTKEEFYTTEVRKFAYPFYSKQLLARDGNGAFIKHDPKKLALNEIMQLIKDKSTEHDARFLEDCYYLISLYANGRYDEKKWNDHMKTSEYFNEVYT